MTQGTRITLFLLGQLIAALRASDPDTFKQWLCGGIKDMGRAAVEKLMTEWINPLPTEEELDRIVAWYLGVSL